jgi:hypothetical protein
VLTATCPAGTRVVGGGCDDFFTSTRLRTSAPSGTSTWRCQWENFQINGIPLGFGASAFCLANNVDIGLQTVTTTSTNPVQIATCPAGKQAVGGGCNDLGAATFLRTTIPDQTNRWRCEWQSGSASGFTTTTYCINNYLDVGFQTVKTQTFSATTNVQTATCPAGKKLVGGGCSDFFTSTRLRSSAPSGTATWRCTWEDFQVNGVPLGFGTTALCSN